MEKTTELAQLDALRQQIEILGRATTEIRTCTDIGQVKQFIAMTQAAKMLAQRLRAGTDVQNAATAANLWGMRRLGQLLGDMELQKGRPNGKMSHGATFTPTLDELGITRSQSSRTQSIAEITDDMFAGLIQRVTDAAKELTTASLVKIGRQLQIARKKAEYQSEEKQPGSATVVQSDAIDYLQTLELESVDLLLTDPPYSTDVDDIGAFARSWIGLALACIRPTGRAYIFIGAYPEEIHAYLDAYYRRRPGDDPHGMTLEMILPWVYRNTIGPATADGYKLNWQACLYFKGPDAPRLNTDSLNEKFSVQDFNAPDGRHGIRWHPWEKPAEIAERFIGHATRPGDLVLDPFAGTGTFLAAAARLGRVGVGCEIDEEMIGICMQKGVQLGTGLRDRPDLHGSGVQ
jgi:16S rRNA G966 N2-methylase RsmD